MTRHLICILFLAVTALAQPLPEGHPFYQTDFEGPAALKPWSGKGQLSPPAINAANPSASNAPPAPPP